MNVINAKRRPRACDQTGHGANTGHQPAVDTEVTPTSLHSSPYTHHTVRASPLPRIRTRRRTGTPTLRQPQTTTRPTLTTILRPVTLTVSSITLNTMLIQILQPLRSITLLTQKPIPTRTRPITVEVIKRLLATTLSARTLQVTQAAHLRSLECFVHVRVVI